MPDPTATPPVAGTPAPDPSSTPTPSPVDAEVERLRKEVMDLRAREGRFRNEKGVREARIRELEALLAPDEDPNANGTPAYPAGNPVYGRPTASQTSGYVDPQRLQQLQDNQDDLRLRWELGKEGYDKYFSKAVAILNDPVRGPEFLAARWDGTTDYYKSAKAAIRELQLQEFMTAQKPATPAAPNPNLNQAVISGVGAAAVQEPFDIEALRKMAAEDPEGFKAKFPEAGGGLITNR